MFPFFNSKAEKQPKIEPQIFKPDPLAGFPLTGFFTAQAMRDIEAWNTKPVIRAGWPRAYMRKIP